MDLLACEVVPRAAVQKVWGEKKLQIVGVGNYMLSVLPALILCLCSIVVVAIVACVSCGLS